METRRKALFRLGEHSQSEENVAGQSETQNQNLNKELGEMTEMGPILVEDQGVVSELELPSTGQAGEIPICDVAGSEGNTETAAVRDERVGNKLNIPTNGRPNDEATGGMTVEMMFRMMMGKIDEQKQELLDSAEERDRRAREEAAAFKKELNQSLNEKFEEQNRKLEIKFGELSEGVRQNRSEGRRGKYGVSVSCSEGID